MMIVRGALQRTPDICEAAPGYGLEDSAPVAAVLRAAKLVTRTNQLFCLVRSISSTGLTADLMVPMRVSDQVWVQLGAELVPCDVTSTNGNVIQLAFQRTFAVEKWLAGPAGGQGREAPRVDVDLPARLQVGSQVVFARLRDISIDGARIETDDILLEGDELTLSLRNRTGIRASVIWTDGDFAGLRFQSPVSIRDLAQWLSTSSPALTDVSAEDIRSIARQ